GTGRALARRGYFCAVALQSTSGNLAAREIVLEALDLFLFAIHEPDVIAKIQVQIFVPAAGVLLFYGLELEEQIVAEGAHQAEARVFLAAKLFNERAQNGEDGGLLAAFLLGEELGEMLQAAAQQAVFDSEFFPVWMTGEHGVEHLADAAAA